MKSENYEKIWVNFKDRSAFKCTATRCHVLTMISEPAAAYRCTALTVTQLLWANMKRLMQPHKTKEWKIKAALIVSSSPIMSFSRISIRWLRHESCTRCAKESHQLNCLHVADIDYFIFISVVRRRSSQCKSGEDANDRAAEKLLAAKNKRLPRSGLRLTVPHNNVDCWNILISGWIGVQVVVVGCKARRENDIKVAWLVLSFFIFRHRKNR